MAAATLFTMTSADAAPQPTGAALAAEPWTVLHRAPGAVPLHKRATVKAAAADLPGADAIVRDGITLRHLRTAVTATPVTGKGATRSDFDGDGRDDIAAFSDSGRLYAVDAETRRIVEFDAYSNPSDFVIADVVDGATFEPVGLAISGSAGYLMVTDRGARTVRVYDTTNRTLTDTIHLDFAPSHMQRLSTGATYLLNRARGKDWLLVLDATDKPRVYFVPAAAEVAQ